MGARSSGREAALQMLYALEASGTDVDLVVRDYWREVPGDTEGMDYANTVVRGVAKDRAKVDEQLANASHNWRLERMARVDRNVLRLGAWELLSMQEVPRAVIIDEAVELAKRFGGENSGAFVNGLLDRIAEDLGRS